ncbi:MAG: M56 family metallopeptidase [Candidatus Palauibacterales bacterium]|nr:M56 family metallopeptidase [Candidatus Palauibacterales bacterium]
MNSAIELLFSVTVRASILVVLAWGASLLLRRKSATIRHMVWASAAIGALVLLAAAPFAPTLHTTSLPVWQNCTVEISPVHIDLPSCGSGERAAGRTAAAGSATPPADDPDAPSPVARASAGEAGAGQAPEGRAPAAGAGIAAGDSRGAPPAEATLPGLLRAWNPDLSTALVGLWAAGALAVLLTILLERLWVRRLSETAREAGEQDLIAEAQELARGLGLPARVDLHLSREDVPPLSWGFWRPRILLPDHAVEWPEDQRRAVLLHELGHARRRDVFTQTVAAISCAVFWFNPLVWFAAARMRDERERACDDLVLQSGVGSTSYAECLLDLARRLSPSPGSRIALVGMTRGTDLVERVDRLVSRAAPRQPPGRTTTFVSVLAALAVLGTLAPHVIARPECQGRSAAARFGAGTLDMLVHPSASRGDAPVGFAGQPPGEQPPRTHWQTAEDETSARSPNPGR